MAISVTCGSCQAVFRVKDEHAGKRGKCPRCQTALTVPSLPASTEPDEKNVAEKNVAPSRSSPVGSPPHLVLQEILRAFRGDIPLVKRTTTYRLGILFLTAAVLVLPALYLALVTAVAYLLYYHATANLSEVVAMRHWTAIVFLYVGPLIVGAILLFFMVKPLFARRSRASKVRTLEFGEEPVLFALVTRVAQAVGAPEPKHINVDCRVNASAGFGGVLGVVAGGDLVLTVGLPLVAGLSVQQFAGVIAHELGHFTQGAGMRLSYVVRSVNSWLARVVYERDDWDESLVRGCEEGNRLSIFLLLAIFCVWLTRRVLWLLMVTGHALSCFMLRQMEYDADRYETRLAGTEAFVESSRRLVLLDLASNSAYALADKSWNKTSRLPDDLSALIVALADRIPPDEFRTLEQDLAKRETGFFDTHPAHGERLASARREGAPGTFHLEGPATRLLKDFPKLSRTVTLDFYRQVLGKRVRREALVPAAILLGGTKAKVGIEG